MGDFTTAALGVGLFYLLTHPDRVKSPFNLTLAIWIFAGSFVLVLFAPISTKAALWMGVIQDVALAVSIFFLWMSVSQTPAPSYPQQGQYGAYTPPGGQGGAPPQGGQGDNVPPTNV